MDYFSIPFMSKEYLRFKLFPDKQTAEDFADVLKQNNINYQIEEDALVFDPSYANNPLAKDYVIEVKQSDFKAASPAYDEYFAKQLTGIPGDYYLYTFTNDELQEILAKPDEWGSFDYQLAQELLRQRGIEITKEETEYLKPSGINRLPNRKTNLQKTLLATISFLFCFSLSGLSLAGFGAIQKNSCPTAIKYMHTMKECATMEELFFLLP